MPKRINFIIEDDNEKWLRQHTHRKGDVSNIINESLELTKTLEQEKGLNEAIKRTLERESSLYLRSKIEDGFLRPFLRVFIDELREVSKPRKKQTKKEK